MELNKQTLVITSVCRAKREQKRVREREQDMEHELVAGWSCVAHKLGLGGGWPYAHTSTRLESAIKRA